MLTGRGRTLASLLLLPLLIFPPSAMAHGILVSAIPTPNSILSEPPHQLVLVFSENLAASGHRIQLRDSEGNILYPGEVVVDPQNPAQLSAPLPELPEGVYTVEYRVVSAVDGHLTLGSYSFGIGDPVLIRPLLTQSALPIEETQASPIEAGLRWLGLLGQAAVLGGLAFSYLLWRGLQRAGIVDAHAHIIFTARWKRTLLWGWGFFLLSHLGGYGYRALQQASSAASSREWLTGLFNPLLSSYGQVWVLNLALILFYGLSLRSLGIASSMVTGRSAKSSSGQPVENWQSVKSALFLGALLAFSQNLAGHAAALAGWKAVIGILGQSLHILAVSFWVGGLIQLGLNVPRSLRELNSEERDNAYAYLIPRFSTIALVSVGTLAASGLVLAWLQVGTIQGLIKTDYGTAILVKTLIFLPLLGLGALNLLYLVPRIRGFRSAALTKLGSLSWPRILQRSVRGEVVLASLALVSAAVLSTLPPAWVVGRPVLPPSDSQALALLREADVAMNSLNTLREHQFHRDGEGNVVHAILEYQVPDRFRYQVAQGPKSISLGNVQYYASFGEPWKVVERTHPFVFPNFRYAERAIGVHIDGRTELDGQAVTVVGFWLEQDLKTEIEMWIDEASKRVLQMFIEGPGLNVEIFFQFNPALDIKPPPGFR